jgi:hypothetical protein
MMNGTLAAFVRERPPIAAVSDTKGSRPRPRRATSAATAPGSLVAATSRALSDALQRRHRSTDVMTSIRFMATRLTSGYPRVLRPCQPVTRRRLPEAYAEEEVLADVAERPLDAAVIRYEIPDATVSGCF